MKHLFLPVFAALLSVFPLSANAQFLKSLGQLLDAVVEVIGDDSNTNSDSDDEAEEPLSVSSSSNVAAIENETAQLQARLRQIDAELSSIGGQYKQLLNSRMRASNSLTRRAVVRIDTQISQLNNRKNNLIAEKSQINKRLNQLSEASQYVDNSAQNYSRSNNRAADEKENAKYTQYARNNLQSYRGRFNTWFNKLSDMHSRKDYYLNSMSKSEFSSKVRELQRNVRDLNAEWKRNTGGGQNISFELPSSLANWNP